MMIIPVFITKEDLEAWGVDLGKIRFTRKRCSFFLVSALISWGATYIVIAWLKGQGAWGIEVVSFIIGNFFIAPLWMIMDYIDWEISRKRRVQ